MIKRDAGWRYQEMVAPIVAGVFGVSLMSSAIAGIDFTPAAPAAEAVQAPAAPAAQEPAAPETTPAVSEATVNPADAAVEESAQGQASTVQRYRSAQMQDIMELRWEKQAGGEKTDLFNDVISRRSDLMTIAVGSSMSHSSGRKDAWVVALDSEGELQWERSIGSSRDDSAQAVIDLPNGEVVIAGFSSNEGEGGGAALAAKLDSDGEVLWQTFVDTAELDSFSSVVQLSTGDLVFAGTSGHLAGLLARLDPEGNIVWQKTLGESAPETVAAMTVLANEDIVIIGERAELFDSRPVVSRISNSGDEVWELTLDGTRNEVLRDITSVTGGDLLVVGEVDSPDGDRQGWLLRVGKDGELQWEKALGSAGEDSFRSILRLADQSLVVAGVSDINVANAKNSWVLRVSEDGEVIRSKFLGGEFADGFHALSPRSDGSIVAAGYNQSWHDEPTDGYVAMLGAPLVRSAVMNYDSDDRPEIFIPGSGKIYTESATVEVLGNVLHRKPVSHLFVDGRPARVLHSGAFTSRIPVPIGTTEVKIEAVDMDGAVGTALVQITRTEAGQLAPQDLSPLMESIKFGNYHAIIIGNNGYTAEGIPALKTAEKDARALADILQNEYEFDVDLLIDAGRKDILSALEKKSKSLREDDNLLVYYAGHGYYDEDVDLGYWLPVDADLDSKENWIRNSTITDNIKELKAKHVLLVADSCFSGTLLRSVDVKRTGKFYEQMASRSARLVMTSGGIEPVIDGGGDGHSVFARSFLDKLRSESPIIDGTSLFQAIREPVVLKSEQVPQYSNIRFIDSDGGDFLFVRKN